MREKLTSSFEAFLEEYRDETTALRLLLRPDPGRRPGYDKIRELAETIQAPPRQWTPERLWQAYEPPGFEWLPHFPEERCSTASGCATPCSRPTASAISS